MDFGSGHRGHLQVTLDTQGTAHGNVCTRSAPRRARAPWPGEAHGAGTRAVPRECGHCPIAQLPLIALSFLVFSLCPSGSGRGRGGDSGVAPSLRNSHLPPQRAWGSAGPGPTFDPKATPSRRSQVLVSSGFRLWAWSSLFCRRIWFEWVGVATGTQFIPYALFPFRVPGSRASSRPQNEC